MFSRFNPLASTLRLPPGFPPSGRYAASTTTEYKGPFKPPTKASDPRHAAIDPSCSNTITLKCLHQLYNTDGYVPVATEKNSIGVTGYLEQYANEADLRLFYQDQLPEAVNSTFEVISIAG
jgi:tripeptidyl-peptidase I